MYHARVAFLGRILTISFQLVALLVSVAVHESAHGMVALHFGDRTARDLGRISWNPLRHLDPIGSVLVPLMLAITGAPVFGWARPVPVHAENLGRPRRDMAWVSAAGPVSNLALAGLAAALLMALKAAFPGVGSVIETYAFTGSVSAFGLQPAVAFFLVSLVIINVVLAVFNLIPVPPLDGAGVLSGFLSERLAAGFNQLGKLGFVLVLALLWLGAFDVMLRPILAWTFKFLLG